MPQVLPSVADMPVLSPRFRAVLAGAAFGNALILGWLAWHGHWLIGADGLPPVADFATFWAASRMAIAGGAAAIYDPVALKAVEVLALGRDFAGSLGWYYPPTFLLAVAPLSLIPLTAAHLVWVAATLSLLLWALWRIAGRDGILIGLAFPGIVSTTMVGQNGFLSAALFAGGLLALPGRPVVAGLLLGALSYKPHFAVLVPLALAFGGFWRAFAFAAISAVALAAASLALFGSAAWSAFFASLGATQAALLGQGLTGYDKLQSLFGLLRHAGMGLGPATAAQALLAACAALAVAATWRRAGDPALKAAALVALTLLATPYLYVYDLIVLAVPVAFLARGGLSAAGCAMAGAAMLAVFAYPFLGASCGFAATLIVAAMVLHRAWPLAGEGSSTLRNSRRPAADGAASTPLPPKP